MKITHIAIKNYRSLKDISLPVDDYTALVGANGAGKSCILYALDWFFNGKPLQPSDVSGYTETGPDEPAPEPSAEQSAKVVEVTVTFGSLTPQDRERLQQYGKGDTASFRRSWSIDTDKDKVVGNTSQGPGFAEVRKQTTVGPLRAGYQALREQVAGLPDLGRSPTKDTVLEALVAWENDPANADLLVTVNDEDANHMFGINGANVIKECVRLVLVPAAADIAAHVGAHGKGSALNELIGTVMSKASSAASAAWFTEHKDEIEELNQQIRTGVEQSTGKQALRINTRLAEMVPNASVTFTPSVPEWTPKNDASVTTDITINGLTNDVSRQGHGVQRAVMIAMFQSLVPDAAFTRDNHQPAEDEDPEEAAARLQAELDNLPALIVCIEEPEIYQHPIRARAFARILTELSSQASAQVLVATHSPYFVRPTQFSSLRRISLVEGASKVDHTTVAEVAAAAGTNEDHVQKIVEKRLPTTFSEGFFCDAAVLVEGDTDKIVLEALAERLQMPLDSLGISILDVSGKEALKIPYRMLCKLNVPTYVIADGDGLGYTRKPVAEQERTKNSHKSATDKVIAWLPTATAVVGTAPFSFEDPTVITDKYTMWQDDIEEELGKWPSFAAANPNWRSKDVREYRAAVMDADLTDLPAALRAWVETIAGFGR